MIGHCSEKSFLLDSVWPAMPAPLIELGEAMGRSWVAFVSQPRGQFSADVGPVQINVLSCALAAMTPFGCIWWLTSDAAGQDGSAAPGGRGDVAAVLRSDGSAHGLDCAWRPREQRPAKGELRLLGPTRLPDARLRFFGWHKMKRRFFRDAVPMLI